MPLKNTLNALLLLPLPFLSLPQGSPWYSVKVRKEGEDRVPRCELVGSSGGSVRPGAQPFFVGLSSSVPCGFSCVKVSCEGTVVVEPRLFSSVVLKVFCVVGFVGVPVDDEAERCCGVSWLWLVFVGEPVFAPPFSVFVRGCFHLSDDVFASESFSEG